MNKSELFQLTLDKRPALKAEKKMTADSFFERAKDLCGIAKLSKNFSAHKKYMTRYGEQNQSSKKS